ncbi:hypothetical protein ARTSIC4J27_15 [Pseudarthrobacter siccitolerans]|uniref:Uncharacterized protein n=1 Tax=Pseudarthrobacter siccitolerans TaxID=861266 RepID=A0A024GWK5_9MICC|nr:hypothetical protein [Pseudarthrobacter siccitolerans]CCQ44093.1 hypothetical protein ARTSIC4J27_15 [Pseudarthrobacter siccitolerans]
MSADRLGGWLGRWLFTLRRHVWKSDAGTAVGAAVEPSLGAVRLQLTVGEHWL